MIRSVWKQLLPHERWFGAYLLATGLRLALGPGPGDRDTLLHLGLLALDGVLIARCLARPTRGRWLARLLFHPLALNLVFLDMKTAIPRIAPQRMDAALARIDGLLLGGSAALGLERWAAPVLTELLSLCYLLFFPYLLYSLVCYFRRDLATLQAFLAGLFTLYGLGFLGYSLVPAQGPWVAMADRFRTVLAGGPITHWNDLVVRAGSNGVDVFPSLHCAVSSYLLACDRRWSRWRFRLFLAPCAGLWLSTLYLRYHYTVDVVCGFLLSAFAYRLAVRRAQGDRP